MAYIRTKKIKNNDYAYLVENKWKKAKGGRQKVKQYLGRVHSFPVKSQLPFSGFSDKEFSSRKELIKELIKWELTIIGFKQNKDLMINKNIKLNVDSLDFDFNGTNKGVIKLNEGFLCSYTLNQILNFRLNNNKDDYRFARGFVEAGLRIPKELFVELWQNIIK